MIYLVGSSVPSGEGEEIRPLSVEDSLAMVRGWPVVQLDTETTGLDCHVCRMRSVQLGYKDFRTGESTQVVIDCSCVDITLFKDVIEKSYLIGHNLKFDLKFLYCKGIVPLNVYDTMICEQVLYLGWKPKDVHMDLGSVLRRRTGKVIDKSFQSQIARKGLTREGIVYSAHDVAYLQDIRREQMAVARSRGCLKALEVENRCVPAMAYLEWCGVHLDEGKWRTKMESDRKQMESGMDALDRYVADNPKLSRFVSGAVQPELFGGVDIPRHGCSVDWNSPAQVIPVFKTLGFNTRTLDKKTKKEKDTVEAKLMTLQTGIDDEFLKLYFGYKAAVKNVGTYGQNFINLVNPGTGRLHTVFKQIGTVTGRMSSGERKPDADLAALKGLRPSEVAYCNMQNLPARGEAGKVARACFTAEPGNVFISCDYSAEESRVSAIVWDEEKLLGAFRDGIDTHNLYAKLCFPDELKDVDVHDVKKARPDLRQKAKSAEFAVSYGSDGSSIALNIGMPVEKAKEMVANIVKGMPGMAKFKRDAGRFLVSHGYLVINKDTGHRIWWPGWARWRAFRDRLTPEFWAEYDSVHRGTGDSVDRDYRWYRHEKNEWLGKNVLNYPIQGGCAVVLKRAAGDFFRWIVRSGNFGRVKLCVLVHDETCCECPENMKDTVVERLERIMADAASAYYKGLDIPAEASVGDHWIH